VTDRGDVVHLKERLRTRDMENDLVSEVLHDLANQRRFATSPDTMLASNNMARRGVIASAATPAIFPLRTMPQRSR
jgi:hypothetical protein